MSFRNTIILAIIVALFGVYLYNVEKPAMEREAAQSKLLDVDRAKVTKLSLDSAKGKLELARTGDQWQLVAPPKGAADTVTVDGIIGALVAAEVKKTVEEKPGDLKAFGLDPPEASVVLTLDGGQIHKLAFGKKTPIGASAYARRGDEPAVLLTTDAVRTAVQKDLTEVRDKTVLSFVDADVKEITIRGVEGEPTVLRKDGNDWTLVSPLTAKADVAQVRSLLASLHSLRATAFVDDAGSPPDAKYQLSPPRVQVDLAIGADGAKKTLLVGGATAEPAKQEIYAQIVPGDTVYVVGAHLFSMVAKKAMDFRDKTVLAFDKDKVRSVVAVRSDGDGFAIEKKADKWTLADAGDAGVKEFVAARLVDDLRDLKGVDIASESGPRPEFQLDHPQLTFTIAGDAGPLGTIRIAVVGEGAEKRILANADGSQTVYLLQDYVFQRVDKKRGDFLNVPTPTPAAAKSPDAAVATSGAAAPVPAAP
jgi:hypothetical protein